MFQPQSQRKLYKFSSVFFFHCFAWCKRKTWLMQWKKKLMVWHPKEICANSHLPSLHTCSPVSESDRTHSLQYPSHWVPWELRPLWSHELIMHCLKLYPSIWSIFWNVRDHQHGLIMLCMWDWQFWGLYKCMCLCLSAVSGW